MHSIFNALTTVPETRGFSPLAANGVCIFPFYPLSEVMMWQVRASLGDIQALSE